MMQAQRQVNYPSLTEGACNYQMVLLRGWLTCLFSPTQSDLPTGKVGYKPLLFKEECLCHTHRILRLTGLRKQPHTLSKNYVSIAERDYLSRVILKGGIMQSTVTNDPKEMEVIRLYNQIIRKMQWELLCYQKKEE